jgi:Fe-S-cluster containining protein
MAQTRFRLTAVPDSANRAQAATVEGEATKGQVQIDKGATPLVDLVPFALELTNLTVKSAGRREQAAGRSISCRAGCGACCRQMVCLSVPECLYLTDVIESLENECRQEVLARFRAAERRLEDEDLLDLLMDEDYDDERVLGAAPRYFFLGIPCPFLADESCSVHPHRPIACREYNVTSPAEWCADPIRNPIAKVPMPQPISAALAKLTAELVHGGPRLIPLTLAPRWVNDHNDLRRRTWPGMELFNRFIAHLGELPASR